MSIAKLILFTSVLILVFSNGCSRRETTVFKLSGQIKNPLTGNIFLSQEEDINRKKSRVVAVIPIAENGKFDVDIDLEPHIYSLDLFGKKTIILAIDKGQKIVVEGDTADFSGIAVSGSEDTSKLEAYEKFRKESLDRLVISVRDKIKKLNEENSPDNQNELEKLSELEVENYSGHKDELVDFVKNKMGNSIAVYATSLRWDGDKNIPFFEALALSFEEAHRGLAVTERLKEKVNTIKNTQIGGTAPKIRLPDANGNELALASLKGKYILIDFWASWCGPCRRESLIIRGLYDKYKNQGFEIYGVSLDDSRSAWLSAIDQDQRKWNNVSSLEGFETAATFDYGVSALPAKFIVDANGKIVSTDIHGKQLQKTIDRLFAK